MKHYRSWSGRRQALAICVVTCAAAIGIPSWRLVAQETPQKEDAVKEKSVDGKSAPGDAAAAPSARDHPATRPTGAAKDAITVAGRVTARTVEIKALSGGMIRETHLQEGRRVKQGDLLVQLDDKLDAAQVQAAEADLKLKLALRKRQEEIYKDLTAKGGSNPELDEARANVDIAEISVKYREASLALYRINAPFDGVIVNAKAQVGQVVSNGDPVLAMLVDLDHPMIEFSVTEKYSTVLERGAKVKVTVPALERDFTGQVTVVADEVDPATATVRVKATLDGPVAGLKPGMFARIVLGRPPNWSEQERRR